MKNATHLGKVVRGNGTFEPINNVKIPEVKGSGVRGSYRNDKAPKNGSGKQKAPQKQQKGGGPHEGRKKPIELRYVPPNDGEQDGEAPDDSNLIIAQDEEEFHDDPNGGGPPILHEGDPQDHQDRLNS